MNGSVIFGQLKFKRMQISDFISLGKTIQAA